MNGYFSLKKEMFKNSLLFLHLHPVDAVALLRAAGEGATQDDRDALELGRA